MNAASKTSFGYLVAIAIDVILVYAVQHLLDWHIAWITPEWSDVIWAANLSLTVSIVGNALLLAYDGRWFHRLVDFVGTMTALFAGYWIYMVFPFDFGSDWNALAHLVGGAVLIALAIATIVTAILAIADLLRTSWRQLSHL